MCRCHSRPRHTRGSAVNRCFLTLLTPQNNKLIPNTSLTKRFKNVFWSLFNAKQMHRAVVPPGVVGGVRNVVSVQVRERCSGRQPHHLLGSSSRNSRYNRSDCSSLSYSTNLSRPPFQMWSYFSHLTPCKGPCRTRSNSQRLENNLTKAGANSS